MSVKQPVRELLTGRRFESKADAGRQLCCGTKRIERDCSAVAGAIGSGVGIAPRLVRTNKAPDFVESASHYYSRTFDRYLANGNPDYKVREGYEFEMLCCYESNAPAMQERLKLYQRQSGGSKK